MKKGLVMLDKVTNKCWPHLIKGRECLLLK